MTDNKEIVRDYREWILGQKKDFYRIEEDDPDHIHYIGEHASAEVIFYHLDYEIVQFTITSPEEEDPLFFLHFELKDMEHARQLFNEMIEALEKAQQKKGVRVLLCCTSGLTTSFFAEKLNEAAKMLGNDYSFSAVAYTGLFEEAADKDVILLAPQIGFQLKKTAEVLNDKIVLALPAMVFARYDVNAVFELIREKLEERKPKEEVIAEDIIDPEWDSVIAVIAMLRRAGKFEIHYRVADHEEPCERGRVIKDEFSVKDIEDMLDVMFAKHPEIRGVAVVTPGTVADGHLTFPQVKLYDYDLIGELTEKYGRRFVLCNDANATAQGYYANHRDCGNLIAYYQAPRAVVGGAGILLDGKLQLGRKDVAGECVNYLKLLNFSEDRFDLARTPEGCIELVTKILLPMVCTVGPDTVCVYCDLITDVNELREEMKKYLREEYLPQFAKIPSSLWEMYYGAGVIIYNVLHGNMEYRPELKEYLK